MGYGRITILQENDEDSSTGEEPIPEVLEWERMGAKQRNNGKRRRGSTRTATYIYPSTKLSPNVKEFKVKSTKINNLRFSQCRRTDGSSSISTSIESFRRDKSESETQFNCASRVDGKKIIANDLSEATRRKVDSKSPHSDIVRIILDVEKVCPSSCSELGRELGNVILLHRKKRLAAKLRRSLRQLAWINVLTLLRSCTGLPVHLVEDIVDYALDNDFAYIYVFGDVLQSLMLADLFKDIGRGSKAAAISPGFTLISSPLD